MHVRIPVPGSPAHEVVAASPQESGLYRQVSARTCKPAFSTPGVLAAPSLGPPPGVRISTFLPSTHNVGAAKTLTESNFPFGDGQNTPRRESFHTWGHSGRRWRRLNLSAKSQEPKKERKK